jgi:hypothetical protein
MQNLSIRLATLAMALLLPGALMAQSPSTTGKAPGAAAAAPAASAGAPAAPAAQGSAPSDKEKKRKSRRVTTGSGQQGTAPAGAASAASASPGVAPAPDEKRADRKPMPAKEVGVQRAFADFQSDREFDAYKDKVKAVKTVGECKALMGETLKQIEPRAKAQQKTLEVDIDKACAKAKEFRGWTS